MKNWFISRRCRLHASVITALFWLLATAVQAQEDNRKASDAEQPRSQEELRERAEESDRALEILLRDMAVVPKKGEVEFDFSLFYASDNQTNARTFDAFGAPALNLNVETRSVNTTLTTSYGLTDRVRLDLALPYPTYVDVEVDNRAFGGTQVEEDDLGLGDISFAVAYQLFNEFGARPAVALDLNIKSDTGDDLLGTGNWNVGATARMVKTVDPVVFFGGVGYTHTIEQDGFDPGEEIFYTFATAFSLNDRISVSGQLVGTYAGRSADEFGDIPDTNLDIISMQFVATTLVGNNLFIEPVVGIGLTQDATDAVLGISFVYRLPRFYPLPFFNR